MQNGSSVDTELSELAAAHGVATWYRDGDRRPVTVDTDVVVRVLGLLDVDASTPAAVRAARARADVRPAARHDRGPHRSGPAAPGAGRAGRRSGGRRDVAGDPARGSTRAGTGWRRGAGS